MHSEPTDPRREPVTYRPIGVIRTPFTEQKNTPIQGIFNKARGTVELFPEYESGLLDIETFSHLFLIYHFHQANGTMLRQKPFLDLQKERGIFAIRHFNRPNPIGISIVELKGVRGNVIDVCGMDTLDGTPLLDIKPYVQQFDHRENVRSGWVDNQHVDDVREWNSTPEALRHRDRVNL